MASGTYTKRYLSKAVRQSPLVQTTRAELAMRRERQRREMPDIDLIDFTRDAWPILHAHQPYIENWHIEELADALTCVTEGTITNLAINIPPGYMKSLMVGVFWPAWEWTRNPGESYLRAAHDQRLATRDMRRTRLIIDSDWYQSQWGAAFGWSGDQRQKTYYENDKNGFSLSTSPSSGATGHRTTRLIVDDLVSAKRMYSDTIREHANTWFREEFMNRVVNETPVDIEDEYGNVIDTVPASSRVLIGQRLHHMDVFGLIRSGEVGGEWEWIVLPALFVPHKQRSTCIIDRRTEKGELLFPDRFPKEVLETSRVRLGPTAFSAQEMQEPTALEGAIYKRNRFRRFQRLPKGLETMAISVDAAFKGKEPGKPRGQRSKVSIGVWGLKWPNALLCDAVLDFMGYNDTLEMLRRMLRTYPRARMLMIEDKANGTALIDTLRRDVPGVTPHEPIGDKTERAWIIEPYQLAGNIWVLADDADPLEAQCGLVGSTGWQEEFIDQLVKFEPGKTDETDHVDMTSQIVQKLLGRRTDLVTNARIQ